MSKFKVGDKVVAKKNTPYSITRDGWEGTVVASDFAGNIMEVRGLCGQKFLVESKYFKKKCDGSKCDGSKIVITTDGKTTTARLYESNKVAKTAEAHCSPADTFDFCEGAKIAMARLTAKKEKFAWLPHLYNVGTEEDYGVLGTATKYKDAVGRNLCVGDTVTLFNKHGERHKETVVADGMACGEKKQFISGIALWCDADTGEIGEYWRILKCRSFDEVADGETVNGYKFAKKPE